MYSNSIPSTNETCYTRNPLTCVCERNGRNTDNWYTHNTASKWGLLFFRASASMPSGSYGVEIEEEEQGRATVRYVGSSNVTDLPKWRWPPRGPSKDYARAVLRDMGFLQDSYRSAVYRLSLYMDGFKQTKATWFTRFIGGVLPHAPPTLARKQKRDRRDPLPHPRVCQCFTKS